MLALAVSWIYLVCALSRVIAVTKFQSDSYPKSVPKFNVRLDPRTKQPVVSGTLPTLPLKSTLAEFRKHLQCAPKDPNLNFNNGIVSMYRLAPLNSETVRAVCSFVERTCDPPQCIQQIPAFERGEYRSDENWNAFGGWSRPEMLRVINGTLYNDWPWGMERFSKRQCAGNPLGPLLNLTLSRISDMKDSVFWTGGADPGVWQQHIQFPYLSECTSTDFTDTIFPWFNMWFDNMAVYKKMLQAKVNFTKEGFNAFEKGYVPWDQKVAKAAMFATYFPNRIFLLDAARQRPDLIDSMNYHHECIRPWNPASNESCDGYVRDSWPSAEELEAYNKLPPGYGNGLYNVTSKGSTSYLPAKYKYVVVPLGRQEKLSTSARIGPILFYSGAVVLLPRFEWKYHFSAQFLPWVHYVPLSYSGADLAEKVEWLKQHDDLAQQIAENGRNFAYSYLRFEDFYCYAANTMDAMASLVEHTDAIKKVNSPVPLPRYCAREDDLKTWYSWPTAEK